nr:hypothetical protein [Tanacetum cinerariifolium]
ILDAEGNPTNSNDKVFETYKNVTQEIRDQLNAEAVQIILTGIDNDIYSTIDACPNACDMWKAIERLKQGESINVQDLETNLFWEIGKFTSLNGESLESYYSRFYKMMNELTRNQCKVTNHQVNVQFLLQLQPEWQRFVTLVKQMNQIRAKKIARVANPLALVAQQQQVYHPQTHPTHYNQHSSTIMHQAATRNRGKALVNSPQPIYDQEPSMVDDDDDEMSKEKEIDILMALISLNAGYEGQRSGTVAGARETVGSSMVQKSRIQCYNCKEYGHVARECQKPKRAKDAAYHREKMLLYADLAKERELLASLIAKLKCEIDESKNRNTLLETSNKVLVEKLKSEIADFRNKNKSLTEANNKLSETLDLLYADFKKSKAELK